MMIRALQFLSSEARTLERAVSILAVSALASSLLALFRDRLFAHTFGAGAELDIYYAAFRIPDFLFVAVGALVSVYILIPELSRRDQGAQERYIDTVVAGFSALTAFASIAAVIAAPMILTWLFPRLAATSLSTLTDITRIMLLQPILLGFSNIVAAITQVRARFGLYALSPVLYNIGIILGVIALYPIWGLHGLAWGVVLGAALHLLVQVPFVVSEGFFRRLPRFVEPKALLSTVSISIPRALALSMNQIAFIGLTGFAGMLAPGSIAVFMLAFNLQSVPLAVIGASYSVAAFPTLAAAFSNGNKEEFIQNVVVAARHVLFWSLPAIGLIIVLRAHIVRTVLGSGAFDWTDTRLTAAAFAIFSLALVAQGISLLIVRGYYAAGRTLAPFLASFFSAIGILLLGFLLLRGFENQFALTLIESIMRVEDVPGTEVLALAFAYALVSILGALVLALHFEYQFGRFFAGVRRTFFESLVASLAGAVGAYGVLYILGPLTFSSTLLSVFSKGLAAGVFGIAIASLVYALLDSREYSETVEALHLKLWRGAARDAKTQVVASAEDIGPSRPQ